VFVSVLALAYACKQSGKDDGKETILGKTTLVDDSFQPLIEIKLHLKVNIKQTLVQGKSENELIQSFHDTSRIVVLSRMLSSNEAKYFEQLKIKPKYSNRKRCYRANSNKGNNDTLIALDDVVSFMRKRNKGIKRSF
jgi:phosphate transport system substrate-binding protein